MKTTLTVFSLSCLFLLQYTFADTCEDNFDPFFEDNCDCLFAENSVCVGEARYGFKWVGCTGGCEPCEVCASSINYIDVVISVKAYCVGYDCLPGGLGCTLDIENEIPVVSRIYPCVCRRDLFV